MKKLSIIIPMFNEEGNVFSLYEEIIDVIKSLQHFTSYEIIAVDDGSSDKTFLDIKNLAEKDSNVKIISFTRNFGHEQATYAGLKHSSGDAVVLIDADGQDPPELIREFEKVFIEGYDIVYGQRKKRLNESWLKKFTSKMFYPIFRRITKVNIPVNTGDFCLLNRKVVDAVLAMPERSIFIRGLIYWGDFSKKAVPFIRRSREQGISKYNYTKLFVFALENIVLFSTVPIYCILAFSFLISIGCCLGILFVFIWKMLGYVVMVGWASLMIGMLFLFSCLLFCLGIVGLYVSKIFDEVKRRPIFLIKEKINFD
jgi:polyisoprenyl-phosphate glycosyltransferase